MWRCGQDRQDDFDLRLCCGQVAKSSGIAASFPDLINWLNVFAVS